MTPELTVYGNIEEITQYTYSIYGLILVSQVSLPELRVHSEPLPNAETVHVHLETRAPRAVDKLPLVYASSYHTPSGAPHLRIYSLGSALRQALRSIPSASGQDTVRDRRDEPGLLLRFAEVADFRVQPSSVTVMPAEDSDPVRVRQFLLGPALAVALELRGVPCLHASAVALADSSATSFDRLRTRPGAGEAVGFLAVSTGGKSVLASTFVEAGAALLTDDILPLRRQGDAFTGAPGYPQMKVWPEAARELLGEGWESLDHVIPGGEKRRLPVGPDWGDFCTQPRHLLALYVPERLDEGGIEISPIAPRDALIELVRYSFCARPAEVLGWQPRRLSFFAELVQRVPVRRLRYPSGFEHLSAVHAAIRRDLCP